MENNKTLEESIISAMDLEGTDAGIIKYLPYILSDFWEIGTPSEEIIKIIKKHKSDYTNLSILDLGSGKGAASIKVASELKCKCFGIDALEDFVNFSSNKAKEFSVDDMCTFEKNDIRTRIKTLEKYDVIILGAIGPVLGDYCSTLSQLKLHLNKDGLIIIGDAYAEDDCNMDYPNILKKNELIMQVKNAGMELIDTITKFDILDVNEGYDSEFENLKKRCMELVEKHPSDKNLFLELIERQKKEYDVLKNEVIPAIFIIKGRDALI